MLILLSFTVGRVQEMTSKSDDLVYMMASIIKDKPNTFPLICDMRVGLFDVYKATLNILDHFHILCVIWVRL